MNIADLTQNRGGVLVILLAFTVLTGCLETTPTSSVNAATESIADTLLTPSDTLGPAHPSPDTTIVTPYTPFVVEGLESIGALKKSLGPAWFDLMLKLNRIDEAHFEPGDTLVVPDTLQDVQRYTPFPAVVDTLGSLPLVVLVSLRIQAFAAYASGRLVRWGPTSTGKQTTPTPAALYHTNWKALQRRSTANPAWVLKWCVNIENRRGISLHVGDLPGYPTSHACIRLLEPDARWIYDHIEQWILTDNGISIRFEGTPILIFGEYAFEASPPWKDLLEDPHAVTVTAAEINAALWPLLSSMMAAFQSRQAYRTKAAVTLPLRPQP